MRCLLLQRRPLATLLFAVLGTLMTLPGESLAATPGNEISDDSATTQLSATELMADGDGEIDHVGTDPGTTNGSVAVTVLSYEASGDGTATAEIKVRNTTKLWYKVYVESTGDVDFNFEPFTLEDSQGKFLYLPPEGESTFTYPTLEQTVTYNEPNAGLFFTADRTIESGIGALFLQVLEILSRANSDIPTLPHDEAGAAAEAVKATTQGLDPFVDAATAIRDGDVSGMISAVASLGRKPEAIAGLVTAFDEAGYSVTIDQIKDATTVLRIASVSWYLAEFTGQIIGSTGGDSGAVKAFDFDTGATVDAEIASTGSGGAAPTEVSFDAGDSYASEGIESYSWDFDDGSPQVGSESVEHTYTQPGSYDVSLTVTDTEGNTDEVTQTVQVYAPRLIVDRQTLYEFDFEAEQDPLISSYSWDFGGGSTASGRTPTHTYDDRGTYEVTLSLSLSSGESTEVTRTVYAGPRPVYVDGTIKNDRVWPASHGPYIIDGGLTVDTSATLTIEPGAVTKFEEFGRLRVEGGGTLRAEGMAQDSVVFTSIRDDAYGGDTNGDGSETSPSKGDWDKIEFRRGSEGTFDHAVVRYGGGQDRDVGFLNNMIVLRGSSPTITDSRIAGSGRDGMYVIGDDPYGEPQSVAPTIKDNRFEANASDGLAVDRGGGTVQNNVFVGNGRAASVTQSDGQSSPAPTFERNVIEENEAGVRLSGLSLPDLGTASNYGENVFRRNDSYAVKNTSNETVQAVGNYWDATSVSAIDDKIYDDDEDGSSGPVLFEPFLDAPPEDGGFANPPAQVRLTSVQVKRPGDEGFSDYVPSEVAGVRTGWKVRFKGTVTDADGNPVPGLQVNAYNSILYDPGNGDDGIRSVTTNSEGVFHYPSPDSAVSTASLKSGVRSFWFQAGSGEIAIPFALSVDAGGDVVEQVNEKLAGRPGRATASFRHGSTRAEITRSPTSIFVASPTLKRTRTWRAEPTTIFSATMPWSTRGPSAKAFCSAATGVPDGSSGGTTCIDSAPSRCWAASRSDFRRISRRPGDASRWRRPVLSMRWTPSSRTLSRIALRRPPVLGGS